MGLLKSQWNGGAIDPDEEDADIESSQEPKAMNTFPTPSGIFETLTGIKVPHLETLGDETDVVHLKLNAEDTQEFLFHMLEDILHDSEGMRSDPQMKMNTMFSNPSMGAEKSKCSLTHFIEVFLTGMNRFYGNDANLAPILWSDNAMKQRPTTEVTMAEPVGRATRGAQPTYPWATAMSFQIPLKYYKTYPIFASIERRGMNEAKHLLRSEMDLKELGKKYVHSNYTAEAIAYNNAWPVLINFDAGGDLMASILGMFSYTDISIVNVKDPGDSLRNRNKIVAAIEKISNKYPTLIGTLFLDDFKKVNRIQPDSPKGAWAFIEACRGVGSLNIHINNGLFIDYVVKTYTTQMSKPDGMLPTTKEAIQESYIDYVKNKFKKIMRDEKYVIHKKNVRFIVSGTASTASADAGGVQETEIRLLDVEYYFGKDRRQMKIKFHGSPKSSSLKSQEYDRDNINSASDVGKNIYAHYATLASTVRKMFVSVSNPLSLYDVKKGSKDTTVIDTMAMRVYLECMYKFIGDFCQILYSFYLGSVFGSFDRSAVAVAFFIMRTLTKHKENYKLFKAYKSDNKASVERIRRGLVIATSATYHGKKAPTVSFYVNYDAMNNIETGKTVMKKYIATRMIGLSKHPSRTQKSEGEGGQLDIERIFQLRKEYIHKKMRHYFRQLNTYYLDSDYLPEILQASKSHRLSRAESSSKETASYQSIAINDVFSPSREKALLKKKKGSLLQRVQEQTRQTIKEWIDGTFKRLEDASPFKQIILTYRPVAKGKVKDAVQNVVLQGFVSQSTTEIRETYEKQLKERHLMDKNNYLWNRLNAKIRAYNEQSLLAHISFFVKLSQNISNDQNKAVLEILRKRLQDAPTWVVGADIREQYGLKMAAKPEGAKAEPKEKPEGAKPEGTLAEGAKADGIEAMDIDMPEQPKAKRYKRNKSKN
jgi:hypothetical protein